MIRGLLADDHPLYRQGLAGYLAVCAGIEVVAEVATGPDAVAGAVAARPDVCVLDLSMPGFSGLEAATRIRARLHGTSVLILSVVDGGEAVFRAMRAGAQGYVVKTAEPDAVVTGIRTVAQGGAVFSASLTERLSEWFGTLEQSRPAFAHLTPREREVLRLLADGLATGAIARRLELQEKTVRNVVSAILTKLQVPDRAAAVARVREAGGL